MKLSATKKRIIHRSGRKGPASQVELICTEFWHHNSFSHQLRVGKQNEIN